MIIIIYTRSFCPLSKTGLGTTFATFNLFGKMPNEMHWLRIANRDRAMTRASILKYRKMSSSH